MKFRKLLMTSAILLAFAGAACSDQVMDITPQDQISDADVWTDESLAEAFLLDIYRGVGHGYWGTALWAMTDDGHNTRGGATAQTMLANISPSSIGGVSGDRFSHYMWGDTFRRIRQANIFLAEIDETDFPADQRDLMKGEAHFLRAYFYHNLLKIYGSVPIITEPYGLGDDYEVARATFAEMIDFIVAEADAAASLLPLQHSAANLGRATRGAALALKARMLLFAASDLYHRPDATPETGYTTPQDREAMWRAAQEAAREVMNLGVYDLFRANPASPEEATQNYTDIWLQKVNEEQIFVRYFLKTRDDIPNVGRYAGPNGYRNWGSNTPTQSLVDAYRMIDGSPFDWSNPDHALAPYENRDPRFYASIQYDGAPWVTRPADVINLDPVGVIQTFTEVTLPDGTTIPGLDTRNGPIEAWNGTYAGYYMRKFIDPAVDHQFEMQDVPWIFIRYAEILLNYAEASLELGELAEATEAINLIRRRAAMPDLPAGLSAAQLREEYRNERRIELALEEHRFFDARRWMIAPQVFGENAQGIDIRVKATDSRDRSTYYDYTYQVIDIQERAWDDKLYFMPIHRDEINRNSLLVQNPGY